MIEHATHEIHDNSLEAWHAGRRSAFAKRELEILDAYAGRRRPLADRDVQAICGYPELARCQPRISDLVKKGVLVEVGSTTCELTKKTVRLLTIAPPPQMKQDEFL